MKEKIDSDYLNKRLEPLETKEVYPAIAEYNWFGEHSYKEEKGNYEFTIGKTKITLAYSKPDFFNAFKKVLPTIERENPIKIFSNVRSIDRLVVEKDGASFDTDEIISDKDFKIYFNLGRGKHNSSCIDMEGKIIFLEEDPLSIRGLVALAHEIGHYKNFERMDNPEYETSQKIDKKLTSIFSSFPFLGKLTEEESEIVLKGERDAWAVALNDLRPFQEDLKFNLDDLIEELVHNKCLQSYSDYIRKKLK